jgi:hypothetical protein
MSGVWSQLQATLGETSQSQRVGWTLVPNQIWDSTDTTVSCERDHVTQAGGRAEDETMGEGSDLCEGAGGEAAGESCGSPKEKDGEGESVRTPRTMNNRRERLLSSLHGDSL